MSAQASQDLSGAPSLAGRRRAQLVARGIKAVAAQPLSRSDVQALQADPSPGSRAAVAAKFGRQYDELIGGGTRALADAVLELLMRDGEPQVRQALTEAVASSPNLPHAVAVRLATDDLEVARPILERSPALTDDDLAQIVRTQAAPYALAVAGRNHLSAGPGDLLADTDEPEVIAVLAGNDGAELSIGTLERIRQDYRDHLSIQDRLLRRHNLPPAVIDGFLTAISERVGWPVISQRCMSKAEARQLMARLRDCATLSMDADAPRDPSIERQLHHRLTTAALGPEDILGFLRDGEIGHLEIGLALLADVDPARARRLLYSADNRGLAALCARANFGVPHYIALRMAMDLAERGVEGADPETAYSAETIARVQKQYDLIRKEGTQTALCFAS